MLWRAFNLYIPASVCRDRNCKKERRNLHGKERIDVDCRIQAKHKHERKQVRGERGKDKHFVNENSMPRNIKLSGMTRYCIIIPSARVNADH